MKRCLDLMTSGQWVQGRSHLAVAEEHGVAASTASDWATNASRIVRLAIEGDVEDIRARMLATLGTIVSRSMGLCEDDMTWGVDHKTAIAAMETQAKLLGLVVQKVELAPTPEEAERLVAEAAKLAVAK